MVVYLDQDDQFIQMEQPLLKILLTLVEAVSVVQDLGEMVETLIFMEIYMQLMVIFLVE